MKQLINSSYNPLINTHPSLQSGGGKMRYTGLELFMEKLKQLINYNYNPLINNHPSVLSQMPRFQMLYQQLHNMIQTLLLIQDERYHHQQLQQVTDLKKRFKDAAEEAYDIVDLFLCNINLQNQISRKQPPAIPPTPPQKRTKGGCFARHTCLWCYSVCGRSTKLLKKEEISMNLEVEKAEIPLNLEDVMTSIKSIEEEFITIRDNMKTDAAPTTDHIKTVLPSAAAGTSCTKNPLGTKRVLEDIVVGFDGHAELIRDKLTEDQKQLDVVSIVGMGGLGKTTLATKVFNDPFVMYHFHVRGWVTVSQTYQKQDLLIQILESIGNKIDDVRDHDYSQLRQILHQKLMGKRYLIVIDDIWSIEAWDDLKLSFPNNHTGSRILLTSRLKDVASHAKSHGFIHQLEYLSEEESWEFLCKKVFHGSECPEWLIKPGRQIANNCHGLPLTLVVVAGVLARDALSKDSWERIAQSVTSSYIVGELTGYIETLALSIAHLPGHLRDCFLYLGGFPEDYRFRVRRLIWLWMAEGFIQEDGIRSLEEIAEDHVKELVDRNLVVVATRKSNGGIKSFYIHDLLRELCLEIATKENFFLIPEHTTHSIKACMQRRIFVKNPYIDSDFGNPPRIRSLLRADPFYYVAQKVMTKWSRFWMLLMVLDLRYGGEHNFQEEMSQLIHLRYLAISWNDYREFPSSICKLWSLQTFVVRIYYSLSLKLPKTISDMVNLRHLRCEGPSSSYIVFPAIQKPMNLHTISRVRLANGPESSVKCFPGIRKLSCFIPTFAECGFESLTFLENLKLSGPSEFMTREPKVFGLPALLKSLTLAHCNLPWSTSSIIQSLPNLEVLNLLIHSFVGPGWDAGEEPFRQLKFLKLSHLVIIKWVASSINFPCLKRLVLESCYQLEEIPSEIGDIPTLELISIYDCKDSVLESLDTIQEEQHAQGNFELKIHVDN